MKSLLKVLMRRDGLSKAEAEERIEEARNFVLDEGMDPEDVLASEFGLEPDYVFDLLL